MTRPFATLPALALAALLPLHAGCGGFAGELGESFAEGALDELNHRLYSEGDDEWGNAWEARSVAPRSAGIGCSGTRDATVQTTAGHIARFTVDGASPVRIAGIEVRDATDALLARVPGPIDAPIRLALDLDPEGGDGRFDLLVGSDSELAAAEGASLDLRCEAASS